MFVSRISAEAKEVRVRENDKNNSPSRENTSIRGSRESEGCSLRAREVFGIPFLRCIISLETYGNSYRFKNKTSWRRPLFLSFLFFSQHTEIFYAPRGAFPRCFSEGRSRFEFNSSFSYLSRKKVTTKTSFYIHSTRWIKFYCN